MSAQVHTTRRIAANQVREDVVEIVAGNQRAGVGSAWGRCARTHLREAPGNSRLAHVEGQVMGRGAPGYAMRIQKAVVPR